jgi:hypothetical protein
MKIHYEALITFDVFVDNSKTEKIREILDDEFADELKDLLTEELSTDKCNVIKQCCEVESEEVNNE